MYSSAQPFVNRLLLSYNFEVSTQYGRFRASRVRDIGQSVEIEEVREGGENQFVHSLVRPASKGRQLVFERGYCEEALNLRMERLLGLRQSEPLTICIYDRSGSNILKNYCVSGWMITRWQLSDLDAGASGGILLETVEMCYERLESGGSP